MTRVDITTVDLVGVMRMANDVAELLVSSVTVVVVAGVVGVTRAAGVD